MRGMRSWLRWFRSWSGFLHGSCDRFEEVKRNGYGNVVCDSGNSDFNPGLVLSPAGVASAGFVTGEMWCCLSKIHSWKYGGEDTWIGSIWWP